MQPSFGQGRPNWLPAIPSTTNHNRTNPQIRPWTIDLPPAVTMYHNAVYYPNWRVYRNQPPSSLNMGMISHVFYAFARVSNEGLICFSDEWADDQMEVDGTRGCLRSFAALKRLPENGHLRIILSIGGGGEGSRNFPEMARDAQSRHRFAASARAMVDNYGLDGIDIDWEHPSSPAEGTSYLLLLQSLRAALPRPRYILTTALPAGIWALRHIPLNQASSLLDLINLMCYDFSGPWTPLSGHHAALFPSLASAPDTPTAAAGINHALDQGVPSRKILLGIPVYGRSFLAANGPASPYAGAGGEEGVFEYAALPRPGTEECVDGDACAAYCVGGDGGFVSYDNPFTVAEKARYVQRMRLGGLFYWTATGDAPGRRSLVYSGYAALHDTA